MRNVAVRNLLPALWLRRIAETCIYASRLRLWSRCEVKAGGGASLSWSPLLRYWSELWNRKEGPAMSDFLQSLSDRELIIAGITAYFMAVAVLGCWITRNGEGGAE